MLRLVSFCLMLLATASSLAGDLQWKHLSSSTGDLPLPGTSTEQTGALVVDLDKDGTNDFVISFRKVAPALVWYRRTGSGWDRFVLDPSFLTVEAGGAGYDIDGDGDPAIVFGGDWARDEVCWWGYADTHFDPETPLKTRASQQR